MEKLKIGILPILLLSVMECAQNKSPNNNVDNYHVAPFWEKIEKDNKYETNKDKKDEENNEYTPVENQDENNNCDFNELTEELKTLKKQYNVLNDQYLQVVVRLNQITNGKSKPIKIPTLPPNDDDNSKDDRKSDKPVDKKTKNTQEDLPPKKDLPPEEDLPPIISEFKNKGINITDNTIKFDKGGVKCDNSVIKKLMCKIEILEVDGGEKNDIKITNWKGDVELDGANVLDIKKSFSSDLKFSYKYTFSKGVKSAKFNISFTYEGTTIITQDVEVFNKKK